MHSKYKNLLNQIDFDAVKIMPLGADASSKQFYRAVDKTGKTILILEETHQEDFENYIRVTDLLSDVNVPQILAQDSQNLILALEDLGEHQNLSFSDYPKAIAILNQFKEIKIEGAFFDCDYFLKQSAAIFQTHHSDAVRDEYRQIIKKILDQINWDQMIFTHRDFHAENLMPVEDKLYVIDFQQASLGPIGYDLGSLLQDARRDVPEDVQEKCYAQYRDALSPEQQKILDQNYDLIALMRHLRIWGIFLKLAHEGKSQYLVHVPRVIAYIHHICKTHKLYDLEGWLLENMRHGKITKAMILAAGHGKRMRPLTDETPKPLLELMGKPILDHVIEDLKLQPIHELAINAHHLAEQVENYCDQLRSQKTFPKVHFSFEEELLETAGGVQKMIPCFSDKEMPFFALNGDIYWQSNQSGSLFDMMQEIWDPSKMDGLLWMVPIDQAFFFEGKGDYFCDDFGLIKRQRDKMQASPYIYGGVQILKPKLFENRPLKPGSNLEIWDQAEKAQRLYGCVYEADWYHLGTPEALAETERLLSEKKRHAG